MPVPAGVGGDRAGGRGRHRRALRHAVKAADVPASNPANRPAAAVTTRFSATESRAARRHPAPPPPRPRGRRGPVAGTVAARLRRMPILEECSPDADVAAALCHEIQQPLDCLLASLERAARALRRHPRGDAADEQPLLHFARWLADAESTAQHLQRVVADVGRRARREPRHVRQLDLRATVRAAAAMAQSGKLGADIAVDAPLPAWVDGVDTRLVHVFLHLFESALDDGGALEVRVARGDDDVTVEVRRRPIGLTSPRSRSASGAATDVVSQDLGAAVARQIVAAHGGQLVVDHGSADGSLARLTLPLARAVRAAH